MQKAVQDSPRKSLKYLKEHRLTRKSEFQSVFALASKVTHKYLIALYTPNSFSHARLGIIATKSRLPKAVDRNRLKRVIRESFRATFAELPSIDVIVMLRGQRPTTDPQAIRADVDKLLNLLKIGIQTQVG